MKTKVLNLAGVLYEGEAKSVNIATKSGEVTLLDHHRPLMSVLASDSRIKIEREDGTKEAFVSKSGFLHMDGNNELTLLID
ncbi:hypothetical protein COU19_00970 [Candidatus Kaiserbacteria bacterium CG10_big_fil_rev_8_21_14_0_10_56_12]|uniref:ATP synthase F1 complex delta/epsilon subunit N-terminal domain-containing protein n=1 Tax=Candidatus Kaiserbacteria bacterium CG10_big_fil_rev_8_21_14_0_10_56_12 TaxID=1974611 RepID=A0A2H0UCE6_9BACT|nr:MAG: hypothetical protein COU19_00970 [Candidatus Kaiserbacteria bacterium CG10_big_fil_rev_8_21_14_0_10_56_12]